MTLSVFTRSELQLLANATARAFRTRRKCLLFAADPLSAYAAFTRQCLEKPISRKRLYQVTYSLGRKIRLLTGFADPEDLAQLVFFLYRGIGITMSGSLPGTVTVSHCFFSAYYTPEQCAAISAMDYGIIDGICGGMPHHKLRFTERITEGCSHCMAHY